MTRLAETWLQHFELIGERRGDEGGVVAAEAEGVVYRDAHFFFARDVWRVIEVAIFTRVFQIDRRRNHGIADGECTRCHFYSTGTP